MHSNFTREDLIKHLYCETTPEEAVIIEKALGLDAELKAEMEQLQEAKLALDNGGHDRPHMNTLDRIRAYSMEKNLQETH